MQRVKDVKAKKNWKNLLQTLILKKFQTLNKDMIMITVFFNIY